MALHGLTPDLARQLLLLAGHCFSSRLVKSEQSLSDRQAPSTQGPLERGFNEAHIKAYNSSDSANNYVAARV
jgi:hypothetical protein